MLNITLHPPHRTAHPAARPPIPAPPLAPARSIFQPLAHPYPYPHLRAARPIHAPEHCSTALLPTLCHP
eukprot:6018664-Prymnesium_polylepis.1